MIREEISPAPLSRNEPAALLAQAHAASLAHVQDEVARLRAVVDSIPGGVVETDYRGLVCLASAPIAAQLRVPIAFLTGKPFIHFVARGDCALFRRALSALARSEGCDPFLLRLRARHGGPLFVAEARVTVVARPPMRTLVWTLRPWLESRAPAPARTSFIDVVRAAADAVRPAACVVHVELAEGDLLDRPLAPEQVPLIRDALDHLASAGLRLAKEGDRLRVDASALDDDVAVVAFGNALARIPLRAG